LLHFCVKITRDVIDPAKNSRLRDVATAATIIDVVLNIILIFYGSCFNFSLRRNCAEKVFGWLTNFTNSAGIRLSYKITALVIKFRRGSLCKVSKVNVDLYSA